MTSRIPVLMYHSIAPASTDYLTVARARFGDHIRHLADHYRILGLGAIEAGLDGAAPMASEALLVTFDDALEDNLEHALPALERCGAGAVFFAIAGALGRDTRWDHKGFRIMPHMTGGDLQALVRAGHEVGNHSLTHQRLSKLSRDERTREITEAHQILTAVLGRPPVAFAYPYGSADDHCATLCRERYRFAFTTVREGGFDWREDAMRIRRIYVAPTDEPADLDRKIACYRSGLQHA